MEAGDKVLLNFPAANRDPAAFDRADEVVLDRADNRHIAFGTGIHRCAGSNLARMELRVALEEWLTRIPTFRLGRRCWWSLGQAARSGALGRFPWCSGDDGHICVDSAGDRHRTCVARAPGSFPHGVTSGGGRQRSNAARKGNRKKVANGSFSCDWPGGRTRCSASRVRVDPGSHRFGAAGTAPLPASPLAPFHLIAAEQHARRRCHQGLGQQCRRPDLSGRSLPAPYHRHQRDARSGGPRMRRRRGLNPETAPMTVRCPRPDR